MFYHTACYSELWLLILITNIQDRNLLSEDEKKNTYIIF